MNPKKKTKASMRDNPCQICGYKCSRMHIHHIIPGVEHNKNYAVLCPNCYTDVHAGKIKIRKPIIKTEKKEGCSNPILTKVQREIQRLIIEKGLSISEVAQRRGISRSAVQKTRRQIIKKIGGLHGVGFSPFLKGNNHKIRLHGEQYVIRILYKFPRYDGIKRKGPVLMMGGSRVLLHSKKIEIYMKSEFWGEDAQEATQKSLDHLERLIRRIEHDVGVLLIKDRYHNIRRVNAHYAETNNEIAKDAGHDKIKIFASDDGKLWFQVDNSFKLHEGEALHPVTGKENIETVQHFLNDLRDNNPPLISELASVVGGMVKVQEVEVKKWGYYAETIRAHVGAIKELGVGIRELNTLQRPNKADSRKIPKQGIIDRLFEDDALKERFHAATRAEQDRILGLK